LRFLACYWLPVVLWMVVIFGGSGDLLSEHRTSRFLGPLLHWLLPGLGEAAVGEIQYAIRKAGHLTEYAMLALLVLRAVTRADRLIPRPGSWRSVAVTMGICCLYAIGDEVRQSFVPSRYGSRLDVLIDALGAAGGLGLAWVAARRRTQPLAEPPSRPCPADQNPG
jgi:VanZ family protein